LFDVKPGNLIAGILKPATASAPIIRMAKSIPTAAKYPALCMASDIVFSRSEFVPQAIMQRLI
jgi:hypothetical protein